jgi:hypothetical protein
MRQFSSIVFGLSLAAAACGGGGGEPDSRPASDARQQADAPPPVPDAPPPVPDAPPPIPDAPPPPPDATVCLATADYGAATGTGDNATHDQAADFYNMATALNADAEPDLFALQLYAGFGPFIGGGVTTGTFAIAGDDTNYATCGVCGLIIADLPASGMIELTDPQRIYLAQSGTVTITSLSPNLTGTIDNLVLAHVTIDPATAESTVVPDCTSTIGSLSFDAPVTQQLVGGPSQILVRRPAK